jgi:hypothetical protein
MAQMEVVMIVAGRRALGAFPNFAIPDSQKNGEEEG